jgi:hypothetical protein
MTSTLLSQILRTQNPRVSARECVSTPYLPRTPVGVGVGAATASANQKFNIQNQTSLPPRPPPGRPS